MLKKYTAFLFICISGIIYAGHSFIPHRHDHEHLEHAISVITAEGHDHHDHDHHEHHKSHHENHDDHKSSEDDSKLWEVLAHFTHGEIFFKDGESHEIKIACNDTDLVPVFAPLVVKWIEGVPIRFRRTLYHYKNPDYHSLTRVSFGLRGPPVVA